MPASISWVEQRIFCTAKKLRMIATATLALGSSMTECTRPSRTAQRRSLPSTRLLMSFMIWATSPSACESHRSFGMFLGSALVSPSRVGVAVAVVASSYSHRSRSALRKAEIGMERASRFSGILHRTPWKVLPAAPSRSCSDISSWLARNSSVTTLRPPRLNLYRSICTLVSSCLRAEAGGSSEPAWELPAAGSCVASSASLTPDMIWLGGVVAMRSATRNSVASSRATTSKELAQPLVAGAAAAPAASPSES
mmetsp:Transcript_26942/g.68321  ORF Transcript_26942/g.68321 Transcript_26942/m.68321 type:complete len:253 (+) Transcript_26942:607-1365(+)